MEFETVQRAVEGVPYIDAEHAKVLYDFIVENRPRACLELGFAHGASACYVAAALEKVGGEGHLTAVDLESGREWQQPSIEDLLDRTGLGHRVTVLRENLSYTWFLKKKIEELTTDNGCEPYYDFCYIDGPKNWTVDGLAFFLVDKVLREGGSILFDDLNWSYDRASDWSAQMLEKGGILVGAMAQDERSSPHVEAVFRLLVMQHPNYSQFEIQGSDWAWAKKVRSDARQLAYTEVASLPIRLERRIKDVIKKSIKRRR